MTHFLQNLAVLVLIKGMSYHKEGISCHKKTEFDWE